MKTIVMSLKDVLISRVKNLFLMNFIFAWMFINYEISLTVLFKEMPIDEKIQYIQNLDESYFSWVFLPIIISLVYIFLMPFINLGLTKLYDKYVKFYIKKHEHNALKEHYKDQKAIEEERLRSVVFLERSLEREEMIEDNKVKKEALSIEEIEKKLKKETLGLQEKENSIQEKIIELQEKEKQLKEELVLLQERENKVQQMAIELEEKENNIYKNSIKEKVKASEIAAELGITSKNVLKSASKIGINIKAANSSVTMEEADNIMKYIMSGGEHQAEKAVTSKEEDISIEEVIHSLSLEQRQVLSVLANKDDGTHINTIKAYVEKNFGLKKSITQLRIRELEEKRILSNKSSLITLFPLGLKVIEMLHDTFALPEAKKEY